MRASLYLIVALCATAPSITAQSTSAKLDAYLTARAALGQFNSSALVAKGGQVLLEKGYGFADVEHRVNITPATRFAVASITKMFTDAAILRLQEDGKLTTADSLCKWVDTCPESWHPVTITQLMHHTSGIPDYEAPLDLGSVKYMDFMSQSRSAERIVEQARSKPLDFVPGTKFSYSNTAYILLGQVIEKASGKTYQEFVRERVLAPAKLRTPTFVSGDAVIPDLANGYRKASFDFAETQAGMRLDERTLKRVPLLPLDGPHADGDLVATAHELWQWTESLADSTALSPSSIREMFTPGLGKYGTGWFIGERFGQRTASHTGSLPGFASLLEWWPDTRTTIVLLSNVEGIRQSILLRDLAAIVMDKPYDLPVARKLVAMDSLAAVPLNGNYALDDGTTATVRAEKTMLGVAIPGRFEIGAFPITRDEFYAPFFDNVIKFERGPAGAAQRIMLRINGVTLSGTRK